MKNGILKKNSIQSSIDKRAISTAEKATLKNLKGQALTLLGPEAAEVDELILAGFSPEQIVGIDIDPACIRAALRKDYKLNVYGWQLKDYLTRIATYGFSYIHLDYCGFIHPSRLEEIRKCSTLIRPQGRLRITFLFERSRVLPVPEFVTQFKYTHNIIEEAERHLERGFNLVDSITYTSNWGQNARLLTFWFDKNG